MIILDTNLISGILRPTPDARGLAYLAGKTGNT
jgi:predicted nucleic acid-binding protein